MLPQCLLLVASAFSLVSAVPTPSKSRPMTSLSRRQDIALLDLNGLPAPKGQLVSIGAGHGVQQYKCTAAGGPATSVGALAVLYDATATDPAARAGLTAKLLRETPMPLNLQDPANVFPTDTPPVTVGGASLAPLGRHFFDAGTPTFEICDGRARFAGAKAAGIPAPAGADEGLQNTGAVDWLYLTSKAGSVGISSVYRIETAGGGPLKCATAGQTFNVSYAALYVFYN
jgi:hypothetical protein